MTTYIVSGFPRSGTSMLMQALEAGGVELVYSGIRDKMLLEARSDEQYRANPESLYEIPQPVQNHPGFPMQYAGKGLKVLLPPFGSATNMWLGDYFIIVMRRDPEETRQSYEAFFQDSKWPIADKDVHRGVFDSGVTLLKHRIDSTVLVWDYQNVITNPLEHFIQVPGIDARLAASIVDPLKQRFVSPKLVVGA